MNVEREYKDTGIPLVAFRDDGCRRDPLDNGLRSVPNAPMRDGAAERAAEGGESAG